LIIFKVVFEVLSWNSVGIEDTSGIEMPVSLLDTVTHGWDDTLHEENLRRCLKLGPNYVKRNNSRSQIVDSDPVERENCNCLDDVYHGPPGVGLCSVIRNKLAYISISAYDVKALRESFTGCNVQIVSSDLHRQFVPLCDDFGPVNLAVVCRFYRAMVKKLEKAAESSSLVIYCIDPDFKSHANACFLLGSFLVLHCGMSPADAAKPFYVSGDSIPLRPFRDASWVPSDFDLELVDCFTGIARAVQLGWFDPVSFDVEQVSLSVHVIRTIPLLAFFFHLCPLKCAPVCSARMLCVPIPKPEIQFYNHNITVLYNAV
jgi:hypothetical protein